MEKYYPFYCGTQGMDWQEANCLRCKKLTDEPGGFENIICDIDRALSEAFWKDGSVSKEIAERMGYLDNKGYYCWMCPEVDWTEEWKFEYQKRHSESEK